MKIKAVAKVRLISANFDDRLTLKVSFKLPHKLFKVVRKTTLSDLMWGEFDSRKDYYEDCVNWLENKEAIIEVAKKMIFGYINETDYDLDEKNKEKHLKSLLKDYEKGIEIEVETK